MSFPHEKSDKGSVQSEKGEVHEEQADSAANSISSRQKLAHESGIKPIFLAKVNRINEAISECGMGTYQWKLFISGSFGYFADNIWLQAVAIVMPQVANETGWRGYPEVRLATLALYVGLILGATFWGMSCDIIGRRIAWNATLIISGIFGVAAGAAPTFVIFCAMIACIGFGVGGNLPVDGALFLEFLPGSHQYLLTLMSLFWAIGQVVASLIAWVFIARFACDPTLVANDPTYICDASNNSGWRYTYYTLGAMILLLSAIRFFVLPMDESPKFLVSIGRDKEAVEIIHKVAKANGVVSTLTVEDLRLAALPFCTSEDDDKQAITKFSVMELIKTSLSDLDGEHTRGLFATPRLAYSSSLIFLIFGLLGLAFPLFNAFLGSYLFLKQSEIAGEAVTVDQTYSAYTYQAACGIIGSILAAIMVQSKRGGRKFAMSTFTLLSGIFLFGLTQSKTSIQVNVLTCFAAMFQNAFYGVLYGYAPEVFPTPHRGTGDAIAAAVGRIFGLFAPIIAVYSAAAETPDGPVLASGAIFVATGLLMLLLPVETRGKTAL